MTTYNREKYVGAAIESVLNSSFKDFELVIVDDRSKDKTVDIVREWQAKDDRVKLSSTSKTSVIIPIEIKPRHTPPAST